MYEKPKVGDILPAQPNLSVSIPSYPANYGSLEEWQQAEAQDDAFRKNKNAAALYLNHGFPSWVKDTYEVSNNPDLAPPQPPAAFVVVVIKPQAAEYAFDVVPSGGVASDGTSSGPYVPVCGVPLYKRIQGFANPADNKIANRAAGSMVTITPVDIFEHTVASNGETYQRLK